MFGNELKNIEKIVKKMKKDRLKTLLYNAIVWIEEENGDFFTSSVGDEYKWFEQALGITKDEMKEIGVDWLKAYENDVLRGQSDTCKSRRRNDDALLLGNAPAYV